MAGVIAIVPASVQPAWGANFSSLVARVQPTALILLPPFDHAADVLSAAAPHEIAVLLMDDIEQAHRLSASGVYLSGDAAAVAKARATLGANAIIGAECPLIRHDAMEKAEAGADFIAFQLTNQHDLPKAVELSQWWNDIIEVPCALAGHQAWLTRETLQHAQFDFLLVTEETEAGESLTFATEFGLIDEN